MSRGPATFPGPWRRARRWLRPAVVATTDWPLLGAVYEGIYRLQRRRIGVAFERLSPRRTVLLRGSGRRRPRPGLTDLDLVLLLDEASPRAELAYVAEQLERVRSLNRLAPLIRDVAFLSATDVRALHRVDLAFLATMAQDREPLATGPQELDAWIAASPAPSPEDARAATLHQVAYWTDRGVQQWVRETERVGPALAARSLAKARHFAARLEDEPWSAARGQGAADAGAADAADLIHGLRTLDDALGVAPERPGWPGVALPRARRPRPPNISGGRWVRAGAGAWLWVLDPAEPGAVVALRRGRDALRRAGARVVSVRQLTRRPFLFKLALTPHDDAAPVPELTDAEASWAARRTILGRWRALREAVGAWGHSDAARFSRFVASELPVAWGLAALPGSPPAVDVPDRAALYAAMADAVRAVADHSPGEGSSSTGGQGGKERARSAQNDDHEEDGP